MDWTSEKPTKPGWYWFKGGMGHRVSVEVCVYLEREPSGVEVYCHTCSGYEYDTEEVRYFDGRWYGPIEPPQDK